MKKQGNIEITYANCIIHLDNTIEIEHDTETGKYKGYSKNPHMIITCNSMEYLIESFKNAICISLSNKGLKIKSIDIKLDI